jgi:hypothetical protein
MATRIEGCGNQVTDLLGLSPEVRADRPQDQIPTKRLENHVIFGTAIPQ